MSLTLIYTPTSPFVRKVLVVAHEGGFANEIEKKTLVPWEAGNLVQDINPVGKVPALVDNTTGQVFVDSKVIVDYLIDSKNLTELVPEENKHQIRSLAAVADSIMEATVNTFIEHNKRDIQDQQFLQRYEKVIKYSLAYLEKNSALFVKGVNLASINTVIALDYIVLRMPNTMWQNEYPNLAKLFKEFTARPSFLATTPPK